MRRRTLYHNNYILATYNITSTTSSVQILGTNQNNTSITYDFSQIHSIEICGKYISPRTHYTFPKTGLIEVKYNLSHCFNTMYNMFRNCTQITSLDFTHCNTTNVTNMRAAFHYCSNLSSIVLGANFTTKNVTDLGYMFHNCRSLSSSVLEPFLITFDTSNCIKMDAMFYGCSSLNKLSFDQYPKWNTSKVTDMHYMFADMHSMPSYNWQTGLGLKLNNDDGTPIFNTSSLTSMYGMFTNCNNNGFTFMNLRMDLSKVTDMRYLFSGCSYISGIGMSSTLSENLLEENVDGMFYGTPNYGSFTYNAKEPLYKEIILSQLNSTWTTYEA